MDNTWYRDMTFYQIWPRSFKDGNGDGIGDLYGVYDKLDYIRSLGVDGIWFSPLYVSPNADYGYDVADYKQISPDYGDLEIFQKVLNKAHALGMKVIMDLVVNHTSDEHEWFQKSRDKNSPYRDYYFWRKGKPGGKLPNNWASLFENTPWEYDEKSNEYYLHLFSKKQVDLNMDNPAVRNEVKDIMRYWLDMGVDGFREDVITFISKTPGLPDDISPICKGMRYYESGPHIHDYLGEFRRDVLDHYNCIVIGEAPMMTPKKALEYISVDGHHDLDLMFHFQHMEADCMFTEYIPRPFNLRKLKKAFSRWQKALSGKAWNTLYLENHDHPRVISRYGSEKYHTESGKMLAASYLFQQGTPFIYQGQEIGMTNIALPSIDDYKDCMAQNQYANKVKRMGKERALALIQRASRDSARTPVQWSGEDYAGFSEVEPWFFVNPNYTEINVEAQEKDPNSLLNFYRSVLSYRKGNPIILEGSYREFYRHSKKLYVYAREKGNQRLLVICSFSEDPVRFRAPKGYVLGDGKVMFSNYPVLDEKAESFITRPYEMRVYEFNRG